MADVSNSTPAPKIPPILMCPIASRPIILPAQVTYPGDLMDRALDKLRTAHLALAPENKAWRDDDALSAVWATIEQAIRDLEPVRNRLQGVEGGAS